MKRRLQWCIALGLLTGIAALLWFGARPWTILRMLASSCSSSTIKTLRTVSTVRAKGLPSVAI
jgi:hypothetical protein